MSPQKITTTKRPYQKPQLERVQLKTDEAVLTACKTTEGFINNFVGDICFWVILECRNPGS
jgi:hypothetical protein